MFFTKKIDKMAVERVKAVQAECKHLNARIKGSERIGKATCPDCDKIVHLSDTFNNWLDELRRIKGEISK